MTVYATQLREGLAAAIDTDKLAGAWQALHPAAVSKAADPALAAFLGAARAAIVRVLQRILPAAWTEGWALGQQSALSLATFTPIDWAGWTPGDHEAAALIAGPGLRQLLASQDITIQSIADSRLEDLAGVLERTLASDVTEVPPLPAPLPPVLSVGSLARQLRDVLDNPGRARMVAHTELARAQVAASETTYREHGIAEIDVLTAEDDKVCPICDAAEASNPHQLGSVAIPFHPMCRCAPAPVVAGAS